MSPESEQQPARKSKKKTITQGKVRLTKPTQAKLQMLVGKALTDDNFRALLKRDPQTAAAQVGIKFGADQARHMAEIQSQMEQVVGKLKEQQKVAVAVLIPIADVAIVSAFA